MKHVGRIKFFSYDKGFGFVNCKIDDYLSVDVFISRKVGMDLRLPEGEPVVCEFYPVKSKPDKYEAVKISFIEDEGDFLIDYFADLNQEKRNDLLKLYGVENQLIKFWLPVIYGSEALKIAQIKIDNFNLDNVVESITGRIENYANKKPGEDDSFSAWMAIKAPLMNDDYIDNVMPKFHKSLYYDRGFYSCYSMRADYLGSSDHKRDEAEVPALVEQFKLEFRQAYDRQEHEKHLVDLALKKLEKANRSSMVNNLCVYGRLDYTLK